MEDAAFGALYRRLIDRLEPDPSRLRRGMQALFSPEEPAIPSRHRRDGSCPAQKAGTSHPVARGATTTPGHASSSASGGAEGSSRCAVMSLPYGTAEPEPEGRSVPAGIAIRAEL